MHFVVPESVSATSSDPDNIQLTFWAGDLFTAQNGKTMRPGFTITAPVVRQVNKEDANIYRRLGHILGHSAMVIFIIGFFIANRL